MGREERREHGRVHFLSERCSRPPSSGGHAEVRPSQSPGLRDALLPADAPHFLRRTPTTRAHLTCRGPTPVPGCIPFPEAYHSPKGITHSSRVRPEAHPSPGRCIPCPEAHIHIPEISTRTRGGRGRNCICIKYNAPFESRGSWWQRVGVGFSGKEERGCPVPVLCVSVASTAHVPTEPRRL